MWCGLALIASQISICGVYLVYLFLDYSIILVPFKTKRQNDLRENDYNILLPQHDLDGI